MSEPLGIALVGCGTVGSAVAKLLIEHSERLQARAGRPLVLRHVVVRDLHKARSVQLPPAIMTNGLDRALADPGVNAVVELVGGTSWAYQVAKAALASGRHLVTANKALLAAHGTELFALAHEHGCTVTFEASVAGGVPVIAALAQGLAANQITSLQAILNGTCNYILSAMTETGQSYANALADAQRLGYAEADPTLDVDSSDAAHKLAILARIAFGVVVPPPAIERRGIAGISSLDIRLAGEMGYSIKLLAEAWLEAEHLALHVEPVLIHRSTPLAQVRGAYNAVRAVGDVVGDVLLCGAGAGAMPTASAVVADLVDLAVGRAQQTFAALRLWEDASSELSFLSTDDVRSRFYVRMTVADQPGVLAEIASIFAQENISIASVIQHESPEGPSDVNVTLVAMTHSAPTGRLRSALKHINRSEHAREPVAYYPVGE